MDRAYFDYNATAPLRPQARGALIAALDAFGNASSVHAEGRAARALVEQARVAHGRGAIVHTDATQAVGRIPVDIAALGVDVLTLSSHKLGGPKGAGAIVRARDDPTFRPLLTGGGQERRARAGTEDVAA